MSFGKWASWCRTAGHPATCACTYPTAVSPGKGEKDVTYAELLRRGDKGAKA